MQTKFFSKPLGNRSSVVYREENVSDNRGTAFLELDRPELIPGPPIPVTENRHRTWVYSSNDEFLAVIAPTMSNSDVGVDEILSRQVSLIAVENWFDELDSMAPPEQL